MSISMYDISVPVFRQILGGLAGVLEKAEAHCAAGKADAAAWIGAKLAQDMLPLSFQVGQACNHSAGAVAKISGGERARVADLGSLAACRAAVAAALADLDAVKADDLAGREAGDVVLETPRGAMTFVGLDYLLSFAMVNFYFHTTTAYDILRAQGLEIGKRDFMGAVRLKV